MVFKRVLSAALHTANCVVLPFTLYNSNNKFETAGNILLLNNTCVLSTALALKLGGIFYLPIAGNMITCFTISLFGVDRQPSSQIKV